MVLGCDGEYPQEFLDGVYKVLSVMGVTSCVKAELDTFNRGMFLKYGTLNGRIIGRRKQVLLSGKNLRKLFLVSTFP